MSKAFSASVKIITWFLSCSLLIWCITLIDLHVLKTSCIPGINEKQIFPLLILTAKIFTQPLLPSLNRVPTILTLGPSHSLIILQPHGPSCSSYILGFLTYFYCLEILFLPIAVWFSSSSLSGLCLNMTDMKPSLITYLKLHCFLLETFILFCYFFFLFLCIYFNWRLITVLWWFLPYIHVNQPWVYMCSASGTSLPPPSPSHLSGSFQCTSPEHLVSCIEPGLVIYFRYDNIHVSMLFLCSVCHICQSVFCIFVFPLHPNVRDFIPAVSVEFGIC